MIDMPEIEWKDCEKCGDPFQPFIGEDTCRRCTAKIHEDKVRAANENEFKKLETKEFQDIINANLRMEEERRSRIDARFGLER